MPNTDDWDLKIDLSHASYMIGDGNRGRVGDDTDEAALLRIRFFTMVVHKDVHRTQQNAQWERPSYRNHAAGVLDGYTALICNAWATSRTKASQSIERLLQPLS